LEGIFAIPLATDGVRRCSVRDFVQDTVDNCPYRLDLITGALVTKVVFDGTRAVGVKLIRKHSAYCASPLNTDRLAATLSPLPHEEDLRVRREVILACGTFNTPQLLMLSGVGPEQQLTDKGISPVRPGMFWPGVGKNLQDRYELAVISEMNKDFEPLNACCFDAPKDEYNSGDPCFDAWKNSRSGVYTTNGALFGIIKRSQQAEHLVTPLSPDLLPPPDLFIFGLLGFFKGYYPSYSADIAKRHNILTWAILKAHTRNNGGEVRLRSADPRDTHVPVGRSNKPRKGN
jgi:choline dehydrogenase